MAHCCLVLCLLALAAAPAAARHGALRVAAPEEEAPSSEIPAIDVEHGEKIAFGSEENAQQILKFQEVTRSMSPTSDKTGYADRPSEGHRYQLMYGLFAMKWQHAPRPPKIFEVGLGCKAMKYTGTVKVGASAQLWRTLFPKAEVWLGDYDETCVKQALKQPGYEHLNVVVGDQGDQKTVEGWAKKMGGNFDIIVDDGGHHNTQIKTTFDVMWKQLRRGGVYFIEDLFGSRYTPATVPSKHPFNAHDDTNGTAVMADVINAWSEQLMHEPNLEYGAAYTAPVTKEATKKYPLPENTAFVFCQMGACAIGKLP